MNSSGETVVRMGEFAVIQGDGRLVTLGLGSCVAVMLHDPVGQIGGLAHVILPSQSLSRNRKKPTRSADTAVPYLVDQVQDRGAVLGRTVARLAGGATMFADLLPSGSVHIGERNVVACRASLRAVGIPIVGEAVGGQKGRSVWFDVGEGTVAVRSVGCEPAFL